MKKKLFILLALVSFALLNVSGQPLTAASAPPTKPATIPAAPQKGQATANDAGATADKQKKMDTVPPMLTKIAIVSLSNSQKSDASDIKKDLKPDSARKLAIAFPNSIIRFTITNPLAFFKTRPKDQARVVLYVDGKELSGLSAPWESAVTATICGAGKYPDFGKTADIVIQLKRNDTTQQAWNFLYNNKAGRLDNFANADVSIGWEGMSQLETTKGIPTLHIVFYKIEVFYAWVGLFVILMAGFCALCFKTNTLRDGDMKAAFSLSLTQLMFWTILVISAFIYTLVLTDLPSAMNSSVLLMLGISISTTGAATLIDTRFKQANTNVQKPSHGFFQDVLTSDGTSYSVQRIQVFAWNLVLGLYFIIYTVGTKTMPVFSSTLLFLAGISSASYIAVKSPENTGMTTNPAAGGTPPPPNPDPNGGPTSSSKQNPPPPSPVAVG